MNETVFAAYDAYADTWAERMRSGQNLAHEYLEKPAMYARLPDLRGKSVLCVGCGSGEECGALLARGAANVTGIDGSVRLLGLACAAHPAANFLWGDIEMISLPVQSFDFVYSSLTLHYLADWHPALHNIAQAMKPGAEFLFSTHHPMRWGAELRPGQMVRLGYQLDAAGTSTVWGDYFTARQMHDRWFGDFDVTFYHQPLSTTINTLRETGFEILELAEPQPTPESAQIDPNFYAIYSKLPMFLIVRARLS